MKTHPQRTPAALTVLAVDNVKPKSARFEMPDGKVGGLRLVVQPSGHKSWALRYTVHGRNRKLTLGPYSKESLDLEAARTLASSRLLEFRTGRDPAAEKAQARRRAQAGLDRQETFGAVWERYLAGYVRPNLKPSTIKEIERLGATLILPKFRRYALSEVATHDVSALIKAQRSRGTALQGNKVFATLRGFFNWCRREILLTDNPCAGLQKPEVETARERVLTDQEVKWLWRACGEIDFPFGPMTRLLLLTAARREEVRGMMERELDRKARLWTLPGKRTKNGKEHSIHLSDAVVDVLASMPKLRNEGGLLFSTNHKTPCSGFSRAKSRLDKLMIEYAKADGAEFEPWRVHDLRRTAASGMARIGIALPVIERALNHISGSFAGIVGVYQRHEFTAEKQAAFDAWGSFVIALVSGSPENIFRLA